MTPIIFYGTSSWTVPVLEALFHDGRFTIQTVVTQPDRPTGRHATLTPSPIKIAAKKLGLPVYQFEKVKSDEAFHQLQPTSYTLPPTVAVLASFGQIIPQRVLDLYPQGIINIHPSLLPKYRGATPIVAAIKAGDMMTGVTFMKMDALMDHGPTIGQIEEPIHPDDTAASLEKRLSQLAATALPNVLVQYLEDKIIPQEQDHAKATTVKLLSREDGLLDWNQSAVELERTVRAFDPWPGTYMMVDGKRLKILQTTVGPKTDLSPSTTFAVDGEPAVACGEGSSLILKRVQPEGKAPMDGKEFLRGRPASFSNPKAPR